MAAGELQAFNPPARRNFGVGAWALTLIIFVVAMAGVAASPIILGALYVRDQDYAAIGDVGQAYGAASAMLAGLALFAVAVSVFVQHRHLKALQNQALAVSNEELVLLAMENPAYRQCWGARVAPEDIGEDLFYYCSLVVKHWTTFWEQKKIDESQARAYLSNFFDSEVPRLFWAAHGDWHRRGHARNRRERFRDLINEEYLRAEKMGPPSRRCEARWPSGDGGFPVINRTGAGGRLSSASDSARRRSRGR